MANLKEEKCPIDYYSREGNSYVSGRIVNLPIGNTKVVANIIQEMTGGGVFRIDTIKPYPEDYTEATNVAKKELHDNARPELSSHVDNMDSYNVIFLGYPLVGNNADAGIHNRDNVAYTVFVHSIENETKMS